MRRAVFLDRDGTINENRADHVKSLDELALIPGVLDALQGLARLPLAIIIISNQSVINRGLTTAQTVRAINDRLVQDVRAAGGRIDGVYICPHRPDEGCRCRKPQTGLLEQARADLGVELGGSYVVGDAATDAELAKNAGCLPVHVLTGRGQAQLAGMSSGDRQGVHVFSSLSDAAAWIMAREEGRGAQPRAEHPRGAPTQ